MKHFLLLMLFSLVSFSSIAQIYFEKGYFINNNGETKNVLIKNMDWKNNPSKFEYRLSENSEVKIKTIDKVKEFGISTNSKYIRVKVKIDRSSDDLNQLSKTKRPEFKEEELFLKILVEGKADLFLYQDGDLKRYFYRVDDSKIEQLIYKQYAASQLEVGTNNHFKQQLFNHVNCQDISQNRIEALKYKLHNLVKYFVDYNECKNSIPVNYIEKQKYDWFNFTVRPGVNISSFSIRISSNNKEYEMNYDKEVTFRMGVEAEFIFPFNKNKWSIFIEPNYQYFQAEKTSTFETPFTSHLDVIKGEIDYKSITLPIGLRYYMFLNEDSKLFISPIFVLDFAMKNSFIEYKGKREINAAPNIAFGLGYKYKNTYSLEIRYEPNRELLGSSLNYDSDYSTISFIFGYTVF